MVTVISQHSVQIVWMAGSPGKLRFDPLDCKMKFLRKGAQIGGLQRCYVADQIRDRADLADQRFW